VDDAVHVAAGADRRDRFGRRAPATVFALVGVALLAGGFAVPTWDTLLFAWGGTALFVALFLGLVAAEPTVPATVAGDIHTAAAARARPDDASAPRYVPTESGVRLASGGEPVGVRLLAGVGTDDAASETPATRAATLVDAVVNHLELAERAAATVEESSAELTARSRLATEELSDHPVASVFAVGMAATVDRPVTVESAVTDDGLVVSCRWDGDDAPGDGGPAADGPGADGPELAGADR